MRPLNTYGAEPVTFYIAAGGGQPPTSWRAVAYLSKADLTAGRAVVLLAVDDKGVPDVSEGHGWIDVRGYQPEAADAFPLIGISRSGRLEVTFGAGEIHGSATADPAFLSATFHGKLSVECGNDTKFETPECAPYRKFLP
jgi:hypothetical protein